MTEEDQNNISPLAYPILTQLFEATRIEAGLSLAELRQEVNNLYQSEPDLVELYVRFSAGERLALTWPDAFLLALALAITPRSLLLAFPSAFDMGGKAYLIIYQLDPTLAKAELWSAFLNLWRES